MNLLSASGATAPTTALFGGLRSPLAQLQQFQRALASHSAGTSGDASGTNDSGAVSLSRQGLALAGSAARADALGQSAIDMAQTMLGDFAHSLLGDAADGMTLSFDAAGVQADTRFAGLLQQNGNGSQAALAIDESADFIGRGHITTSDGHQIAFEVEVHYESHLRAAASSTAAAPGIATDGASPASDGTAGDTAASGTSDTSTPAALQYPGTLEDLLAALTHNQLNRLFSAPAADGDSTAGSGGNASTGSLTLRLLDLLTKPQSLSTQVAQAYGVAANGATEQAA